MIEAVEVVREKDGSFTHPEWEALIDSLGDVEIIPTNIIQLFEKANGLKLEGVTFENTVDEESPAYKEYLEGGSGFASWELAPPSPDAVLLSIHDTEDGPFQLWAVPVVSADSIVGKLAAEYQAHVSARGRPSLMYRAPDSGLETDNFVFVSVRLLEEARKFVAGEVSANA